jgi:uncharacterized cupredoxin-like copper-binding protein
MKTLKNKKNLIKRGAKVLWHNPVVDEGEIAEVSANNTVEINWQFAGPLTHPIECVGREEESKLIVLV